MHIFQRDEQSQGDIFTAFGKLTFVLANLNYCNFRQPVYDMIAFCRHTDHKEELDEISNMSTPRLLREAIHPSVSKRRNRSNKDTDTERNETTIDYDPSDPTDQAQGND